MSPRLTDLACPLCGESESRCPLCLGQQDMAHDEAVQAEGLRLALAFAEYGEVPEIQHEPDVTLPIQWQPSGFEVVR